MTSEELVTVQSVVEALASEKPIYDLVEKMSGWLLQQPEYPLLFLADRATRRRAVAAVSRRLMMLPTRPPEAINRESTRRLVQAGPKQSSKARANRAAKRERLAAKARRDYNREARMSQARIEQLTELAMEGLPELTTGETAVD